MNKTLNNLVDMAKAKSPDELAVLEEDLKEALAKIKLTRERGNSLVKAKPIDEWAVMAEAFENAYLSLKLPRDKGIKEPDAFKKLCEDGLRFTMQSSRGEGGQVMFNKLQNSGDRYGNQSTSRWIKIS